VVDLSLVTFKLAQVQLRFSRQPNIRAVVTLLARRKLPLAAYQLVLEVNLGYVVTEAAVP
jgi:hypothetical protein